MTRTAIAIRHVHFEDLGVFGGVLQEAGYTVSYREAGVDGLQDLKAGSPDLLIVLGGPIGVYDADAYPFLVSELDILRERLAARHPTLGICLGAQLMAAALGAAVKPGVKEIGFSALTISDDGLKGPLRHLADTAVLHWHGDTFDLPASSDLLASTPVCRHQAFSLGETILGLQFHPEVDLDAGLERWLIGHAAELATVGIDPRKLREDARKAAITLPGAARRMMADWLQRLND